MTTHTDTVDTPTNPKTLLLTTTEAYQLVGVSRSTFYELLAEGVIRGVDVKGRRMFRRSDLTRYVDKLKPARS